MTAGTNVIVDLLGGVALLLWGVRMVRTGIMRGWGGGLKHFVHRWLSNDAYAFAADGVAAICIASTRMSSRPPIRSSKQLGYYVNLASNRKGVPK